jgi:MFS family permease
VVAVLVLITMSYSAFLTFGPLLLPIRGAAAASVFFFAMGVARAPSRALAGVLSDRFDAGWILVAGALVTVVGGVISGLPGGLTALLAGGAVYGVGIGAVFSAAYVAMLERSDESAHGVVSAAWNVSVDAGMAIGGTSLAVVIETAGVPGLQAAVPALATLAGGVAILDRARRRGNRAAARQPAAQLAPAGLMAENQGGDCEP